MQEKITRMSMLTNFYTFVCIFLCCSILGSWGIGIVYKFILNLICASFACYFYYLEKKFVYLEEGKTFKISLTNYFFRPMVLGNIGLVLLDFCYIVHEAKFVLMYG